VGLTTLWRPGTVWTASNQWNRSTGLPHNPLEKPSNNRTSVSKYLFVLNTVKKQSDLIQSLKKAEKLKIWSALSLKLLSDIFKTRIRTQSCLSRVYVKIGIETGTYFRVLIMRGFLPMA
jgi:hypothetical protein